MRSQSDPVAVTGIGTVCPLGTTRDESWAGIVAGRCGIGTVRSLDTSALSFHIAGEIRVDPAGLPPPLDGPWVERACRLALAAAAEAIAQADIVLGTLDPYRLGVALGCCQYRTERIQRYVSALDTVGLGGADVASMIDCRMSAPADTIALRHGLRGPKYTVSNACAAGGSAIGIAVDALRRGRAYVMLAGGVDLLELYTMSGFDGLHAVDAQPCGPYSRSTGITIGEGAAVLVLEPAAHAHARGATVLAYVGGCGLSSDAYHATSPDPQGAGAVRSALAALGQAGLGVDDVDYVNGHGTGTRANDRAETAAMHALFGDRAGSVPISSTKSQIGHTMGAAGAIEAAVSVQAIRHQVLPPTVNVDHAALPALGLDIVPDRGRPATVNTVLSNSFAFGGANCSVVFTATPRSATRRGDRRVVITGAGVVTPLGTLAAFREALHTGAVAVRAIRGFAAAGRRCQLAGEIEDVDHLRCIDPSYARRLDQIGRLATAASRMCLDDACLRPAGAARERAGVIFATSAGPVETIGAALRAAAASASGTVNPRIFPNTVLNAAAGHISVGLQLKGPTTTLVGGFAAGLQGIGYAADLIRQGDADVLLAVSADELTADLHGVYDGLGLLGESCPRPYDAGAAGMVLGSGACALALESLEHAQQRGAPILGELLGQAVTADARPVGSIDPDGVAWAESMRGALDDGAVHAADVCCVLGEGRGSTAVDGSELCALTAVFGDADVRLAALSPQLGHTQASQGPLGVVAALEAMRTRCLPDAVWLRQPVVPTRGVRWRGAAGNGRAALVTSAASGGTYASLVLGPAPS